MELSRRDFIGVAAGTVALTQPLVAKKRVPVALELFSLRAEAGKDLPGTLAAIKKMGYEGIELVCEKGGLVSNETLWGRPFKEVAKMVKDSGLKVYSIHHGLRLLQGEQLERTIEINKMVGNRNVTCSWMNAAKTIAEWYEHAKTYNAIQAKLKKHKMNVGLHNHGAEVQLVEGKLPWDVFMDNTDKGVTGQMHLAAFPARQAGPGCLHQEVSRPVQNDAAQRLGSGAARSVVGRRRHRLEGSVRGGGIGWGDSGLYHRAGELSPGNDADGGLPAVSRKLPQVARMIFRSLEVKTD